MPVPDSSVTTWKTLSSYSRCCVACGIITNVHAELQTAYTLSEQLLALAQQVQDSGMLSAAHRASGSTLSYMGKPASALTHLIQSIALYDPLQHRTSMFLYGEDAGVVCRVHAARVLWCLGYPDQGLARIGEAFEFAQQ